MAARSALPVSCRWRNQYDCMNSEDAKRLRELERENARLKKMVADQALDFDMLKELNRGPLVSPGRWRRAVEVLLQRFGSPNAGRARWSASTARPAPPSEPTQHPRGKRQRIGPQRGERLAAIRPDQVWALDFQGDVTSDGRRIRWCNVADEFTREPLATAAARSFTADDTTILLDTIIAGTGHRPEYLRMDNGPEITAAAMRDWCRFADVATAFVEPGSPWQNGYSESFNGHFRDDVLATEQFDTLLEGQGRAEDWTVVRCARTAAPEHLAVR